VLQDEVTGYYQWAFESDEQGYWMGLAPRVLTWKRMQEAALKDAGY
jgi:hypothetical protein